MNIIDLATKTMQTAIKSVVDGIKTVVDGTKTKVDTIDTRTTTMNTNINTINTNVGTLLNGRVVKSVQRGLATGDGTKEVSVTINAVNPNKCLVEINGSVGSNHNVILNNLSANSLTIGISNASSSFSSTYTASWQVIEFY